MTTAFDVAAAFLERAPKESLSAIKLQKLTFYAFGWYAKVTGSELFEDRLVAMQYGPVVSDLLNAHSGSRRLSLQQLAHDHHLNPLSDPYALAVVDAVWASYGAVAPFDLVDMTHLEDPWITKWDEAQTLQRGSLEIPLNVVVDYFANKDSANYTLPDGRVCDVPVVALLPDSAARELTESEFNAMESEPQEVPASAFAGIPDSFRRMLAKV